MIVALLIQGVFVVASLGALAAGIRANDTRRRAAANAVFGIFLAGSVLTMALSFHERARTDVAEKVAYLDRLAEVERSESQRGGRALATGAIERRLELGLGLGNALLLVAGGTLLGMGVAQLLVLRRSRDAGSTLLAEHPE
ncbi:MAG: hypothetical protein M3M95_07850 [Pseudomonadota bacterium]|nr:hypothetical protein [Pseudomonadota bacterium]